MLDDDLKICPFCKSRGATVFGSKRDIPFYYILCINQKCHVRTKNYRTREEAKTAWNRRVNE